MTGLQQAALIEAAREHRRAGRVSEALGLLNAVLQVSPQNPRALHQYGLALIASGRPEGVKAMEWAVKFDPTNPERVADLGDVLLSQSDRAGGMAKLRAAQALAPTRDDLLLRYLNALGPSALGEVERWAKRALTMRRPFPEALVIHGRTLHQAGRSAEAVALLQQAIVEDRNHAQAYYDLAVVLTDVGAPRSEVMKPARIAAEHMSDVPSLVMPVVQYLRDIGDEASAVRLGTPLIEKQMAAVAADEFGQHGIRILMPGDLVSRIGEFAFQLDLHVKMKLLGWLPPFVSVLLASRDQVSNAAFLDCWRPHVTVVDEPELMQRLDPLKERIAFNPVYVRLPDGRVVSKNRAFFAVQQEWQRQGRGPLLDLSLPQVERGEAALRQMGLPRGAWFVCVHVRETGFLKDAVGSEAARNADIRDYFPAMEEITRRGGWVIRLGDASMTPLPPTPQVVDYAVSAFKSAEMDVFLAASCRFFLGTTSGMCVVASVFGTPVGAANFFPMGERLHTARDVVIPKLYRERATGRILSFEECLAMPLALTYDALHFESLGLESIDSEAEDVHDLALEMLARSEGARPYTADDEALQRRWDALAQPYSTGDVGCRIGRGFLRRHRHLFRQPPS